MNPVVYLVAALLVAILLWFVTRFTSQGTENVEVNNAGDNNAQPIQRRGPTRRRNARMGIRQRAAENQQHDDVDAGEEEEFDSNKEGKIGAKKLKKLQEKEEKKRQREMEALEREERKKEQEEREKKHKLEEETRLKEEILIEEEKRKVAEEKERKEHEEYLQLKAMFTVDEEGQQQLSSDEQSQNLLKEFVDYIMTKKVVLLEDLGSHFGLRTQDAIDRVQTMLKDEILTGVIDDRGKFIYISNEEMKAVAKYIEQHGRVSINDLAQASNSLINLSSEGVLVTG